MKKWILAATVAGLPLMAQASVNLLMNGSFENGLNNWTVVDGNGIYPPSIGVYGTNFAFGEVVPAVTSSSISPDAAGLQGVYFVDDFAPQSISQAVMITSPGAYFAGFDYYIPANGAANPGNASLVVTFGGNIVGLFTINAVPVADWVNVATTFGALVPGEYTFTFSFNPLGNVAGAFGKDVVVDRAYVMAVPEPGSVALLLAGLGVVGALAHRRARVA